MGADDSPRPGEDADAAHVRVCGARRAARAPARRPAPATRSWNDEPHPARAQLRRCGSGTPLLGASRDRWDTLVSRRLRHPRPAARAGTTRARGQRRHRQDLDDRGAGRPLRRRGRRPLDEMLVVTFGRAASQELRERVREPARRGRARARRPRGRGRAERPGRRLLADRVRRRAAERAPAAAAPTRSPTSTRATIATTHQFCQLVLRSLGVAGDTDAGAELVEDLDDLRRRGRRRPLPAPVRRRRTTPPPFDARRGAAARPRGGRRPAGRARRPTTPTDGTSPAGAWRSRGASATRSTAASAGSACSSYDDLLSRLADAARRRRRTRPGSGCGSRWQVVLVDEFQDTDPVQWEVLDRAFSGARDAGADRRPEAGDLRLPRRRRRRPTSRPRDTADRPATLATNWRSDAALSTRCRRCSAAPRSATRRSSSATWQRTTGQPARSARRPRRSGCGWSATGRSGSSPAAADRRTVRAHARSRRPGRATSQRCSTSRRRRYDGQRRCGPATSRCIACRNNDAARPGPARRWPPPASRRSSPAAAACSARQAATDGSRLLEALEQPHRSGAGPRRRPHAVLRAAPPTSSTPDGDDLTDRARPRGCATGPGCYATRGVAAVLEAAVTAGLTARVLGARRAASGCSPTCGTSGRRCTQRRHRRAARPASRC